ncbi:MAG: hypothetical protein ACLGGW_06195 [Gammaproteobacteria bacterium]
MIDFDSVLAEARTLATSATTATNRTNAGFQPHSTLATTLLPSATKCSEPAPQPKQIATVASGSKQQIDTPTAPNLERSKVAKVAGVLTNKYCDERTFELYGNQMASEHGMGRVYEVHQKALAIGIHDEQAWDFAEAVAVGEFSGDNCRACLECNHYRHRQSSDHGVCTAAGTAPLQHMARGASVNWDWLNRCPMHTGNNP